MIYYIFLLLFLLIISSYKLKINGQSLYQYFYFLNNYIFFLIAFFLCCGYMNGADWRAYEIQYELSSWKYLNYYVNEPFFYGLMIVFKQFISDYILFQIICKIFVFYAYYSFYKKYSQNIFLSYFLFIPLFGFFLFLDCHIRYMIALGLIIYSYQYLFSSNLIKFSFIVIIASLFHVTVIIFLLVFFLKNIKISSTKLIFIFIIWTLVLTTDNVLFFVNILSEISPFINERFIAYILNAEMNERRVFTLNLLMFFLTLIWILYNKKTILNSLPYGFVFYSLSIIFIFSTRLSVFPTGFRFSYLFAPFYIITVTTLIIQLFKSNGLKYYFSYLIVLYIFIYSYRTIDNHYVYLPYSNYFICKMTGKDYPYTYRDNYNIEHFFNRKGYYWHDYNGYYRK